MRKWLLIMVLLLIQAGICLGQDKPETPSLLAICQYLADNPNGPLAQEYRELLARRQAQTLGPDSTQKDAAFAKIRHMTSSHLSISLGGIFTHVNAVLVGLEYRWGHESQRVHYCLGIGLEPYGAFGFPERNTGLCISPWMGVSLRIPEWKSYVKTGIIFNTPDVVNTNPERGGYTSRRVFTPEMSLEYGYQAFKNFSFSVFVRGTLFPFFDQKAFYEGSAVDYSVLKPLLDERIRAGVILYLDFDI